ncbi:methylthioribulose 1-phosphate dehydratase [Sulfidibacter corallicola]|uniref:Methylthioribulose-1-phosphate dehydratase n=1 Tax=Sulfidibacter corallicola TaxID=2818388 RepID=A0A8A4TNQ1_SULCO|nr:methylthioribulose 1-phosphate dehydratase [Sulfidibacter corallicola]QTD51180.1 methylthioribulose 1-phosphate dehydratase [Sulfidibacter corallicola]
MDPKLVETKAVEVIEAGRFLYDRGWVPATSGNFSARLDRDHAALTASGKHKGRLTRDDILVVDMNGKSLDPGKRPSAETLLHTTLYRFFPDTAAVLHTHSINATVLSKIAGNAEAVVLEDYEVLKALQGVSTHATREVIPLFPNTQDMNALARDLADRLERQPDMHGFLIQGHGLYTWGRTMEETRRHIEAFEFLFACELEMRRLSP